jgi:hypothetical protein
LNGLTVGIGQRPFQSIRVTTRDGKTYDLGKQVAGTDPIARLYRWRQRRKIESYIRDRLASLTGAERTEFLNQMGNEHG